MVSVEMLATMTLSFIYIYEMEDFSTLLQICVRAMYLASLMKPVDPEVEDRLAKETVVMRMEKDQWFKVRPLCGYGLLHAKEEARKVRILRNLMKVRINFSFDMSSPGNCFSTEEVFSKKCMKD